MTKKAKLLNDGKKHKAKPINEVYMRTQTDIRKQKIYEAMVEALGVVTLACEAVPCSRDTYYKYIREDDVFALRIAGIAEIALDFAESKLHNLINKGNTAATIFYLKTKGKKRGYVETLDIGVGIDMNRSFLIEPASQIKEEAS